MNAAVRKALRKVAAAYGCKLHEVEFSFRESETWHASETHGDSFSFRISTPHKGRLKRRSFNEVTSASGGTLNEAVAEAVRYAKYHGRTDL